MELDIYGSGKIKIPSPWCALIYTGNGPVRLGTLSLAQEFFEADSLLDLKVRVRAKDDTGTS